MTKPIPNQAQLNTIFQECRQCGTCCRGYRKITLEPDEVEFVRKMGGHVGVDVHLDDLRTKTMEQLVQEARERGKVFMVHPDDQGCVFLERRNDKYRCRIYHYRPKACRGFRCTLADSSFLDLFARDSILLLGQDRFGLPLDKQ
jgi:uncharacterized protein